LATAQLHHRSGDLAQAEACYLTLVEALPGNADLWHLAGVLAFQQGRIPPAIERYRKAVALKPGFVQALNTLGIAHKLAGEMQLAADAFAGALQADPSYASAAYNLGLLREAVGDDPGAEQAYRMALQTRPDWAAARGNLGNLLRRAGRLAEADAELAQAAQLAPQDADALGNLALLRIEQGRHAEGRSLAERAAALAPSVARWREAIGSAARLQGDVDGALVNLEQAAALAPDDAALLLELALAQEAGAETAAARASLDRVVSLEPDWQRPRWTRSLLLPRVPEGDAEIEAALQGFDANLEALASGLRLDSAPSIDDALDAACAVLPFGLHYLAGEHRERQERFSDLVARVARAKFPLLAADMEPSPRGGRRVRVGFVSSHLRNHVVERYFGRFITDLDAGSFERFVWSTSGVEDERTRAIAAAVEHFHPGERGIGVIANEIRDAALDVLVYLDIGLDPRSGVLASLRLAPVQAALPGHPVTTGLESIDAFLASDAIEPEDAPSHYRERLVRLPGLGAWPRRCEEAGDGRWAQALVPGDKPLFFCLQNLAKVQPSFDDTLARIVAASGARLVFFDRGSRLTRRFAARLAKSFQRHGAPAASIHIEPVHPYADFVAGLAHATLVLDTPGFSGGGTSLDALGAGAAVLTLEGAEARGRQTSGMLKLMGCEELVAANPSDYVSRAEALARGEGLTEARERIRERSPRLFDGRKALEGFAAFLR
ncbi:MAG TPA: tetratricopeptide repeat protein, partial [Usitatibacter sp.]|nr:tetratricopeptide repeat protein [Usitatibacter sp.]